MRLFGKQLEEFKMKDDADFNEHDFASTFSSIRVMR